MKLPNPYFPSLFSLILAATVAPFLISCSPAEFDANAGEGVDAGLQDLDDSSLDDQGLDDGFNDGLGDGNVPVSFDSFPTGQVIPVQTVPVFNDLGVSLGLGTLGSVSQFEQLVFVQSGLGGLNIQLARPTLVVGGVSFQIASTGTRFVGNTFQTVYSSGPRQRLILRGRVNNGFVRCNIISVRPGLRPVFLNSSPLVFAL